MLPIEDLDCFQEIIIRPALLSLRLLLKIIFSLRKKEEFSQATILFPHWEKCCDAKLRPFLQQKFSLQGFHFLLKNSHHFISTMKLFAHVFPLMTSIH